MIPTQSLILLLLITCLLAPGLSADQKWHILETPQLTMLSSVSDRSTKRVARDFHYFREGILRFFPTLKNGDHSPLVVLLVNKKKDLAAFAQTDADMKDIIGFYRRGADFDLIVMTKQSKQTGRDLVYHEYAHRLLDAVGPMAPWVSEGLAQIFESLQVGKSRLVFGRVDENAWIAYRNYGYRMSSEQLLTTRWDGAAYREHHDRPDFYTTALLTTHYFFQNRDPEKRERFLNFALFGDTYPSSSADLKARLGYTYEELDRAIRKYSGRPKYQIMRVEFDSLPKPPEAELRDASLAEANAILAHAKTAAGRLDEAEALIQNGLSSDREYAPLHDAQAHLFIHQRNSRATMASIEKAVAMGSTAPSILILWCNHLLDTALEDGDISNAEINQIARHLITIMKVDPGQAAAYELICKIWKHLPADEPIPQSYRNAMYSGFGMYAKRSVPLVRCLIELAIYRDERDLARDVLDIYFSVPRNPEVPGLLDLAGELEADGTGWKLKLLSDPPEVGDASD